MNRSLLVTGTDTGIGKTIVAAGLAAALRRRGVSSPEPHSFAMTDIARIVRSHPDELIVGLVSISDRASTGAYQDQGLPALR